MIKLVEILNKINSESKKDMVHIDDWKFAHADHLKNMGFDFEGEYGMCLKNPEISIIKKKSPTGDYFVIEAEKKSPVMFNTFEDVINYFDKYPQKEIDKDRDES